MHIYVYPDLQHEQGSEQWYYSEQFVYHQTPKQERSERGTFLLTIKINSG